MKIFATFTILLAVSHTLPVFRDDDSSTQIAAPFLEQLSRSRRQADTQNIQFPANAINNANGINFSHNYNTKRKFDDWRERNGLVFL